MIMGKKASSSASSSNKKEKPTSYSYGSITIKDVKNPKASHLLGIIKELVSKIR